MCTYAGGLASGAQTSFPLLVDVPSGMADQAPVTVTNFATVFSNLPDPNDFNSSTADDTTVVDSTPPVITVPDDITAPNEPGQTTKVVPFVVSVTDNTPGAFVACDPPLGTAFPIGTTTVTCTATDTSLNTDTDSFTITVEDVEPPVLTVPPNITVANDLGLATAVVNYSAPIVADNAPGATADCAPPSGSTFPLGLTTVTCTATDSADNTATGTFTVTVVDTQPPSITVPANITVSADPGQPIAVVNYPSPTFADNAPGVTVVCSPPSGSAFSIGTTTVTCAAIDVAGNTATASFTVTVVDTQPPSLSVPANMTVNATSPAGAVVNFTTTATDNAPGPTVACVPPSGSTFGIGTTTVSCTATDASGNTASKSFQVKVLGAVDQLKNLINTVQGMPIKLVAKIVLRVRLTTALIALNINRSGLACFVLGGLPNDLKFLKLTPAQAAALTADANRIRVVLGC